MALRTAPELESLREHRRRLLAVFPHPDDEAYGAAGVLARAGRDPEAAAVVLCLTRGTASSVGAKQGLTPAQIGAMRERRLEEVARLLPLDGLVVADFPDGALARCDLGAVAAAISGVLEALRPQVVIGHDPRGVNAHPDHIAAHWGLRHALLEWIEPVRFAMIAYLRSLAEAARPRLMFATPAEEIDAVVRLSAEEADAKEAALRTHEALITLRRDGDADLLWREPVERFDFFGEEVGEPLADLFDGLSCEGHSPPTSGTSPPSK